jgi:hypothetical protein
MLRASDVLPPRSALRLAGTVLAVLAPLALVAGLVGGVVAAIWFVLGFAGGLPVAASSAGWGLRLAVAGSLASAAVAGILAAGHAWATALVVFAAALAQAPLSRRGSGLGAWLTILAAIGATAGFPDRPVTAALATVAGVLAVIGLTSRLGIRGPLAEVVWPVAALHAVVVALGSLAAVLVSDAMDVSHAYWMVMTLALVLQPDVHETQRMARDRVAGTLVGVLLAVVAVLVLPPAVCAALGLVSLFLMLGWALAGNQRVQNAYGAPLPILLSSSGLVGGSIAIATERVVLVVAGAVLAVVVTALAVRYVTTRPFARGNDEAAGPEGDRRP